VTLRVVIVDDEAVARSRLRRLLASHADVTIAAEAADGRSAVDAIVRHKPDVVFLDIRMPELDGFEVVAELSPGEVPAIVFVTAFSDHAAKAFDANALDYLLKPYDPERLGESLNRYVESAGNYVRIHVRSEEHRLRIRLSDMEQQLDPSRFARIHRTIIVNVGAVAEIQPWFSGDAIVILKDGVKLRLSRHYRGAIESTFGLTTGGLALDASD